ncbi:MAG: MFS transporter [Chloroflexi bacterium B3_Chlor]|nr:MAG: MFS transporter [Chloroflexi bacterium B3_Chlor]
MNSGERPTGAPSQASHGWRRVPRNVWVLSITSYLTDVSSEMIVSLLPLFLANVLGAGTSVIGLIEGLAETTASVLKVFSGWLSDKLGQRKWLTVAGYGLSTLVKPFLYFATTWSWVLGVRFADRVGKGIRTAPRDALIADSIDETQRGLSFGLHRAMDTAGAFTGLLIAAAVIWAIQAGGGILQRVTFQTVVLVSIVPAAVAVLVLAFGARDMPRRREPARAPSLTLGGFDARYRGFLVILVVFTLGNSSDAFLILRAQERGLSVLAVMGALLTLNLVYSLVSSPAGVLSDRIGRRRLMVGGWLIYGLAYLGFGLASAGWQIWLLYALYGVYYGMTEGVARALVADMVRPEEHGTAYGVYNAIVGVTAFPASLIAGLLWQGLGPWQGFGPAAPFLFGAGLALVAALLMTVWMPRLKGGG